MDNPFPLQTPHVLSALQYLRHDSPGTKNPGQLVATKNIGNVRAMSNLTYSADLVDAQILGVMAPPRTFGLQLNVNY